jgi:hypothetical protein
MIRRKARKKTPENLDFAFERKLVGEVEYKEFWPRWWGANKSEQQEIIDELLAIAVDDAPTLPLSGTVTKVRKTAEEQAKLIDGYVARRKKNGQFSKRGSLYQAIRKGRKRK